MRGFLKYLLLVTLPLVASCSYMPDWMGEENEAPLTGERLSILPERYVLAADPALKDTAIELPEPKLNGAWYQGQAIAEDGTSILRHVQLNGDLNKQNKISDPASPDENVRLTSQPIIIGNLLALLDGEGIVSARRLDKLDDTAWKVNLNKLAVESASASGRESRLASWFSGPEDFIGGNIAFVEGVIIATTGNGHVFALELETGKMLWHRALQVAIQSAPAGRNGLVFVITAENELHALSLKDGSTQWTHSGVPEQTKILSAAAAVPLTETVVVPYSSGEIVSLKQVNGLRLWDETVTGMRAGPLAYQFSDIMATPVSYAGRVFAATQGQLTSLDVMTGGRTWIAPITVTSSPWVAGEWLFATTAQQELVAIHVTDGHVKWVAPLPRYEDEAKKKNPVRWAGPVLAGGRLLVVGSHGELRSFDAINGEQKQVIEVPENILMAPVVANGKVFLFSNNADLTVLE